MSETTTIMVPISPGELVDKITILEIKKERLESTEKIANVLVEYGLYKQVRKSALPPSPEIDDLARQLKAVNERLWDVEDDVRNHEQMQKFDDRFIELARSVYLLNDRRAKFKRQINDLCGSSFTEEKSYV